MKGRPQGKDPALIESLAFVVAVALELTFVVSGVSKLRDAQFANSKLGRGP